MKFVFYDKTNDETNIITNILYTEKITYFVKEKIIKSFFFAEEEDDDCAIIVEKLYDIYVYTDLAHFDFVKIVANKKLKEIKKLERCYRKKVNKKNVCGLFKKNLANTNIRNTNK